VECPGELALSGEVYAVKGVLPAALADLQRADTIGRRHIAEALQYRPSASSQSDCANV